MPDTTTSKDAIVKSSTTRRPHAPSVGKSDSAQATLKENKPSSGVATPLALLAMGMVASETAKALSRPLAVDLERATEREQSTARALSVEDGQTPKIGTAIEALSEQPEGGSSVTGSFRVSLDALAKQIAGDLHALEGHMLQAKAFRVEQTATSGEGPIPSSSGEASASLELGTLAPESALESSGADHELSKILEQGLAIAQLEGHGSPVLLAQVGGAPVPSAGVGAVAASSAGSTFVAAGLGVLFSVGMYMHRKESDSLPPTATISISDTALKAGETARITITFSEEVTGFDSTQDVTVQNGTLSAMTSADNGKTWVGTFTPSVNIEDATNLITLAATYTDRALNNGTATTSGNYAIDTLAPGVPTVNVSGNTLTVTYGEVLDTTNVPAASQFTVSVNGVANPVIGVAVSGAALTLTLTNVVASGANVRIDYSDVSAADDARTIQDVAGNDAPGFRSGVVSDGYIRGAQIYIDGADGTIPDGIPQVGDMQAGVLTDARGNFVLPASAPNGPIIAVGGFNIDTGLPNQLIMKSPAGSTVINPLTTLVQSLVEQGAGGLTAAQASLQVATALGLGGVDLTSFDPLAAIAEASSDNPSVDLASALKVQQAAVQIATIVALATTAPAAGQGAIQVAQSVISNLAAAISSSGAAELDLTNAGVLGEILGSVVSVDIVDDIQVASAAIKSVNVDLGAAALEQIVARQAVALSILDEIQPAAPLGLALTAASDSGIAGDRLTNVATPVVRVTLNVTATDGTAAYAGDVVTVKLGASTVGSATLTTANIANGYVDVNLSSLVEGASSLAAGVVDIAGNVSSTISQSLTVDLTSPAAPVASLVSDTGSSASDRITQNGAVSVSGVETGGIVEYSTDAGATWSRTFSPTGGSNSVQVRQTDIAGNVSVASSALTFLVDTTEPTVSPQSPADGGLSLGLASNLTLLANETLAKGASGVIELFRGSTLVESIPVGSDRIGLLASNSGTLITIDPFADLVKDAAYHVKVSAGAFTDIAGNAWAGIANDAAWNFTGAGATVTVGTAAGDNRIDNVEQAAGVTVSGTVIAETAIVEDFGTADITVTLTRIGSNEVVTVPTSALSYSASGATGTWSAALSTALLTGLANGTYELEVEFQGTNGDAANISGAAISTVVVADTSQPNKPVIAVDTAVLPSPSQPEGVRLTSDNTPTLTVSAEAGATLRVGRIQAGQEMVPLSSDQYEVSEVSSGSYRVTFNSALPDGSYGLLVLDDVGLISSLPSTNGSDPATFLVDTVAPSLEITGPSDEGMTFTFKFNERVGDSFTASDISVNNGVASNFLNLTTPEASFSTFTATVTPTSSTTPSILLVSIAAGAAKDGAGNGSGAASFTDSVMYDTAGNDVLVNNSPLGTYIELSSGNDTIKLSPTSAITNPVDEVSGFGQGDRIDLSALLGSGGSGYTSSAFSDTGAGFVELRNVTLTKGASTTTVKFDVSFDSNAISGSKINGAVIDLEYDYSAVSAGQAASTKFTDPTFGNESNVWSNIVANLSGSGATGKIALTADLTTLNDNPIIASTGKVLGVTLIVNSLVNTFQVGLASKASGGSTEVTTSNGSSVDVDVGATKTAGASLSSPNVLEIVLESGTTIGTVGDNQLRVLAKYDAQEDVTNLQLRYDTNPAFGSGATAVSDIIALDFDGNVANLIPASLIYTG